jgi:PPOX class probable F420-dependent enzyme
MELDRAREFMRSHHRAVLATTRADGRPQLSPVSVVVDDRGRVLITTRETAVKTRNLTRNPRAFLCVMTDEYYGDWVQAEGTAEVIHLPDAMEPLVYFWRTVYGGHPSWDDYRESMIREKRVIIAITLTGAGPDISG